MATQAERRTATTQRLQRAARKLLGKHGFEAVSVDDIAAEAGVTRGALYHYYESKEQLFEAVFEEVERALVASVLRATADATDGVEQLRIGCVAFLDATADARVSRIALIDAPSVLGWSRYRELDEQYFLALLRSAIDSIHPEGRDQHNEMLARALLGALCALAIRAATHRSEREAAKRTVETLVDAAVGTPRRINRRVDNSA